MLLISCLLYISNSVEIIGEEIEHSLNVRNVGFHTDLQLKMLVHNNHTNRSSYITMKSVSKIRHLIDNDMTNIPL